MDAPGSEFSREDVYEALYTRDKTRKKKRWTDAIVKVNVSNLSSSKSTKVIVYDEDGARQITHSFCKLEPPGFVLEDDYEFETEKFIVQILNIKSEKVGAVLPENASLSERNIRPRQKLRPNVASSSRLGNPTYRHKQYTGSISSSIGKQKSKLVPQQASWQPAGIIYSRAEIREILLKPCTRTTQRTVPSESISASRAAHIKAFGRNSRNNNDTFSIARKSINSKLTHKKTVSQDVAVGGTYRTFLSDFAFMKVLTTATRRASWSKAYNEDEIDEKTENLQSIKQTPVAFSSISSYINSMEELIHQEIVIGLQDASKHFWEAAKRLQDVGDQINPFCKCTKPKKTRSVVKIVRKEGRNKGKMFYSCGKPRKKGACDFFQWCAPRQSSNSSQNSNSSNCRFHSPGLSDLQEVTQMTRILSDKLKENPQKLSKMLRASGISFYANCSLVRRRPSKNSSARNAAKATYYFKCPDTSMCEGTNRTKQGDMWILTRSINFSSCCIMRSTFHGFTHDGTMQLAALPECKPFYVGLNEEINVHAVRAFNCTSEFEMLENLDHLLQNKESIPILKSLTLSNVGTVDNVASNAQGDDEFNLSYTCKDLNRIRDEIQHKFTLNEDQSKVLSKIAAKWFKPVDFKDRSADTVGSMDQDAFSEDDVILVHGCFGTGKSYMMVALIHFIIQVIQYEEKISQANCSIRLLVACSTNVAVDRVLKTLQDSGYSNFDRVGVNQSVDKSLRKHVTKLSTNVVVGSTLASCTSQAMKDQTFQIVFLDECSQQIEPSSLMAMGFGCKRALLVGDPLQLPPVCKFSTIADKTVDDKVRKQKGVAEFDYIRGVERAMFVRLQDSAKISKIMLRIQYRLHPTLSKIPNELFYQNALKDGVTENDRKPLIRLKPLVAYDCRNGVARKDTISNSYSNEYEAKVILKLLRHLINDGVPEESIGIICLYRAQAETIRGMLGQDVKTKFTSDRNTDGSDFVLNTLKAGKMKKKNAGKATKRMQTLIQVSTVDAFQGAERDIIILSTVRSTAPKANDNESFISSKTRMCVALSRGKRHLIIVGDLHMLKQTARWSTVVQRAYENGIVFSTKEVEGFLESPIPPCVVDDTRDENDQPTKRKGNCQEADRAKKKKRRKKKKRDISALIDDEADEVDSDEEDEST